MQTSLNKGVKPVLFCKMANVRVVIVGNEELRLPLKLLVNLTHKVKQDGMLVGVEVGFRVHTFRSLIGRVKENEAAGASCVGNNILVVAVQDDGISHTAIGVDEPIQVLRHIPSSNTEGLARRREAVDLVLEERCRRFYF